MRERKWGNGWAWQRYRNIDKVEAFYLLRRLAYRYSVSTLRQTVTAHGGESLLTVPAAAMPALLLDLMRLKEQP